MKIILNEGNSYTLKPKEKLGTDINKRKSILFNDGQIYSGYTDGKMYEDGIFCLFKEINGGDGIGLPYDRIVGWFLKEE